MVKRWIGRDPVQLTSENHKVEKVTKVKGREEHTIQAKVRSRQIP